MPCPGWPDVDCTEGRTARDYLNELVARAVGVLDPVAGEVRVAAAALRDRVDLPSTCEEACAKVYAAHAAVMRDVPSWPTALRALVDEGAIPEAAAALTSKPAIVAAATPSRAPSPRPPRPPKRAKKAPAKTRAPKGRARKPVRRVETKRAKSANKRGTAKPRKKKANGSRSKPKKRRAR